MRPEAIADNPVRPSIRPPSPSSSSPLPPPLPSLQTTIHPLSSAGPDPNARPSARDPLGPPPLLSPSLSISARFLPPHSYLNIHTTRLISQSATIPKRRRCGHTAGSGESQSGLPHPLPPVETPHHLREHDDRSTSHRTPHHLTYYLSLFAPSLAPTLSETRCFLGPSLHRVHPARRRPWTMFSSPRITDSPRHGRPPRDLWVQ